MRDLPKLREAIEQELRRSLTEERGTRQTDYFGDSEIEFRWQDGVVQILEEHIPDDESKPVVRRFSTFSVHVQLHNVVTYSP